MSSELTLYPVEVELLSVYGNRFGYLFQGVGCINSADLLNFPSIYLIFVVFLL